MLPQTRLREIRARHGSSVLVEDISGGLERLPIPVINAINDERAPDLTYLKDYEFAPGVQDLVRGGVGWDGAAWDEPQRSLSLKLGWRAY